MSEEKELTQETNTGNSGFNQLLQDKQKQLLIGGGAVVLLLAAVLFGVMVWLPGQNLKAQKEMYMAEFEFAKDSFQTALNGRSIAAPGQTTFKGFVQIGKEYGMTKAGKLANYYAGVCYLNLGKYQEAVDYLEKGKVDDAVIGAVRLNAIGDAYAGLNKIEEAAKHYEKAGSYSDNERFTPLFLWKAGMAYESLGQNDKALKLYEKVRTNYPLSDEGRDIEKYIVRVNSGS